MINVGIIGCGYWGPNLIRNFAKHPNCHIKWLCDINASKLNNLKNNYTGSSSTMDYSDIIKDSKTDAVVIATPLHTHYDIAKKALLSGKHVFVEKPFVDSPGKAEELVRIAQKNKRILMIGFTYVYNPAIQRLRKMIQSGTLGSIYYVNSVRVNLGIFRKRESVIWDLAVHDFSIIYHWFKETPRSILCTGRDSLRRGNADTVFIAIDFKSGLMVYILVSWLSPIKMRNIILAGSKKMVFFNDERGTEKIKIYNQHSKLKTLSFCGEYQPIYNRSSVFSPWLDSVESVELEVSHFLDCIHKEKTPITNGVVGIEVVKSLAAAEKSLKLGKKVYLFK